MNKNEWNSRNRLNNANENTLLQTKRSSGGTLVQSFQIRVDDGADNADAYHNFTSWILTSANAFYVADVADSCTTFEILGYKVKLWQHKN